MIFQNFSGFGNIEALKIANQHLLIPGISDDFLKQSLLFKILFNSNHIDIMR